MKHDVRLSKQTGGDSNSLTNTKTEANEQDHQNPAQPDSKTAQESPHKKPYFLLSNFRPLKQISNAKFSEITNPQTNMPQVFKKTNFRPEESIEDSNGYVYLQSVVTNKTLTNSHSDFKS